MFVITVRFEIKIFVNISVIQIAYINDTTQFNIHVELLGVQFF